ncbi:hypothetical protein RJT34_01707 [Clitoria ternatea]|uniref:Uncharacterized protein n=1 Tax=Clitoria ternatea TaxID=43366 RepID=A0AAN9KKJ6_CLITE
MFSESFAPTYNHIQFFFISSCTFDSCLFMEDSDISQQVQAVTLPDLVFDDDHSIIVDSWSIKSEYDKTLDDDQRYADTIEALSNANLHAPPTIVLKRMNPIL